jgi:hypothetical protein
MRVMNEMQQQFSHKYWNFHLNLRNLSEFIVMCMLAFICYIMMEQILTTGNIEN